MKTGEMITSAKAHKTKLLLLVLVGCIPARASPAIESLDLRQKQHSFYFSAAMVNQCRLVVRGFLVVAFCF